MLDKKTKKAYNKFNMIKYIFNNSKNRGLEYEKRSIIDGWSNDCA